MKNLNLYLLAILAMITFSCSDDDSDGTPNGGNGSSTAESGKINLTVDGEEKSFDGFGFFIQSDNVTNITNIETGIPDIQIVFNDVAPGDEMTFDLQDVEDNDKITIQHHIDPSSGSASDAYTNVNLNSTEGQITITEYTDSKISGEFNAVLKNPFSEEITIENGTFSDLNIQNIQ